MTRGKIQAGGWEVWATGLVCFSVRVGVEVVMARERTLTIDCFLRPAALDIVCHCHRRRRFRRFVMVSKVHPPPGGDDPGAAAV